MERILNIAVILTLVTGSVKGLIDRYRNYSELSEVLKNEYLDTFNDSTYCKTVTISCNRKTYDIESVKLLLIEAAIKNCSDSIIMLTHDADVGKRNNSHSCFHIEIKKYMNGELNDVDEVDNDLDFFNIRGFVQINPNETYIYRLFPFHYLYSTPTRGKYQIQVDFYDKHTRLRHKSNFVEIEVI